MPYVLQMYITDEFIGKPNYITLKRQSIGDWESIKSKAGYVTGETLFLPDDNRQKDTVSDADIVVTMARIFNDEIGKKNDVS